MAKKGLPPAAKARKYKKSFRSKSLRNTQKAWRGGYVKAYTECRGRYAPKT